MQIPLEKRLRKRAQLEVALLQDEVIDLLYNIDSRLVLHGGTAIWRCYGGSRFSEDLDLYSRDVQKLQAALPSMAASRGIEIKKLKKTENLLFAKLATPSAEVRVEVNHAARVSPVLRPYERANGTMSEVLTLLPEDLLLEKAGAYASRRLVRDIYDVNHLSGYVSDLPKVRPAVVRLLNTIKQPVDEKNLKAIVYAGSVPSFNQIMESLKRRFG